jgi:hypothetical protein
MVKKVKRTGQGYLEENLWQEACGTQQIPLLFVELAWLPGRLSPWPPFLYLLSLALGEKSNVD